jgi:SET domain-containing protein
MKSALRDITPQNTTPFYTPDPAFVHGHSGWANMGARGYGTVALHDIPMDTIIERVPVIIMDSRNLKDATGKENPLADYAFWWGDYTDAPMSDLCAIAKGGLLPLCNHSSTPNSNIRQDRVNLRMEWYALRMIAKGEEITFDYDCDLWFDPAA